ncbi:MAG: hypothetical protein WBA57_11790 [Elainellaceae cyanobacterium]
MTPSKKELAELSLTDHFIPIPPPDRTGLNHPGQGSVVRGRTQKPGEISRLSGLCQFNFLPKRQDSRYKSVFRVKENGHSNGFSFFFSTFKSTFKSFFFLRDVMNVCRIPVVLFLTVAASGCMSSPMGDRALVDDSLPAAAASTPSTLDSEIDGEIGAVQDTRITAQDSEESEPIMPALLRFLDNHGASSQETEYLVEYVDLNEDGIDEALVLFSGEYWCGTGGCNMAVFEGTAEGYALVSNLSLVNAPVWVSSDRSSGWHDLIVAVSGGGIEPKHVALQFNGSRYPVNPSLERSVEPDLSSQTLFRSLNFKSIPTLESVSLVLHKQS